MGLLDRPQDVLMLDGGIPLESVPPWDYEVTFMMDGLINKYDGACTWIVDRELVEIPCLDAEHEELIDFGRPDPCRRHAERARGRRQGADPELTRRAFLFTEKVE